MRLSHPAPWLAFAAAFVLAGAREGRAAPMFQGLGDLPGGLFESRATAVSADGTTVVGWGMEGSEVSATVVGISGVQGTLLVPDFEAFLWRDGEGMIGLGDLPGGDFRSEALAVSFDGSVVVGTSVSDAIPMPPFGDADLFEAFVWDEENGMLRVQSGLESAGLDRPGWALTSATGVSADGRTLVGYGNNPAGDREAWIAVIPQPATFSLVALGLAVMAARPGRAPSPTPRQHGIERSRWPIRTRPIRAAP